MTQATRVMQAYVDVRPVYYTYTHTPVGMMLLVSKAEKLIGIYFATQQRLPAIALHWKCREQIACFRSFRQQLKDYFNGMSTQFSVNYALEGTLLQRETWEQLQNIPYGEQITYKELAQLTSFPRAVRAVATAVGRNPLTILLPCHRVIRSDGKLGGFAAGLPAKQQLLDLEKNRPH